MCALPILLWDSEFKLLDEVIEMHIKGIRVNANHCALSCVPISYLILTSMQNGSKECFYYHWESF